MPPSTKLTDYTAQKEKDREKKNCINLEKLQIKHIIQKAEKGRNRIKK